MNIEVSAAGRVSLQLKQQHWTDGRGGAPTVLQAAKFAGQDLIVCTDDHGHYDLTYLGFQARGFKTMEVAKAAAPEFARKVLERMASLVAG